MAPQGTSATRGFCNRYVRDTLGCKSVRSLLFLFYFSVVCCISSLLSDVRISTCSSLKYHAIACRLYLAAVQLEKGSFFPLACELPSSVLIRPHDSEETDRKRSCRRAARPTASGRHRPHYRESHGCYRCDYGKFYKLR